MCEWQKDVRHIRCRQLMRRLEKVEGRRGPLLRLVVLGLVGKCGAWSPSLCRAAGCGYLLLCSAEREESKTSWKGANLLFSLVLCSSVTFPHPQLSIRPSISAPASLGPGSSLEGGSRPAAGFSWDLVWLVLQVCPPSDLNYHLILLSRLFLDSECWRQLQKQKKIMKG